MSTSEWLNPLQSFFAVYPSCVYYPTLCQKKQCQNKYGQAIFLNQPSFSLHTYDWLCSRAPAELHDAQGICLPRVKVHTVAENHKYQAQIQIVTVYSTSQE